jgi:2-oxoglutarate ferredoxin oxidoreductase subunit delta
MGDKTASAATANRGPKGKKRPGFVEIIKERCKACEICVSTCPYQCLKIGEEMNASGYFVVEFVGQDSCTACGLCADMCPDTALLVWK